jgi:hypothetical protein
MLSYVYVYLFLAMFSYVQIFLAMLATFSYV